MPCKQQWDGGGKCWCSILPPLRGLVWFLAVPRLTPWALFLRRFAAGVREASRLVWEELCGWFGFILAPAPPLLGVCSRPAPRCGAAGRDGGGKCWCSILPPLRGLVWFFAVPRLTPWALFLRRFAADMGEALPLVSEKLCGWFGFILAPLRGWSCRRRRGMVQQSRSSLRGVMWRFDHRAAKCYKSTFCAGLGETLAYRPCTKLIRRGQAHHSWF